MLADRTNKLFNKPKSQRVMKAYIYRRHGDMTEYKKTKCTNSWVKDKKICWKFDRRSAEIIAERYEEQGKGFYTYGIELI